MEETIDLQELFQLLKKRLALIVILALVATVISGIFTNYFMTPIYQTTTQLVVSRSNNDNVITSAEISGSVQLINTFNVILVSPIILDQVIEELNLEETSDGLKEVMDVRNATNSQVMTLTVQYEDPILARDIADKTAEVFEREIPNIMNVDTVSILALAQIPSSPVSPRLLVNLGIGFLMGTMSGIFLSLLLEFLDKTVKTEQEVEKLINIPILGMVPIMTTNDIKAKR
jgi:capsular polysaccharide biosynthesis protein